MPPICRAALFILIFSELTGLLDSLAWPFARLPSLCLVERVVGYNPEEIEDWIDGEPKFRVRLDEPFRPFTVEDFEGRDISSPDFLIALAFTLEGFGVGHLDYSRDGLLGFNPRWVEENAATPLGPATLSYRFTLSSEAEGIIVPPLQLSGPVLYGRTDRYPPDQLLDFPSYGRAVLGRCDGRIYDPELHKLPLVHSQKFLLPEWREIRTVYLPENPKILSDLRVTFLSTEPNSDRFA